MNTVRLYFDADAGQRAVVRGLQARGVDVMTATEAGLADATDEQQLEFARDQARALFTFNAADFFRIHTEYLTRGKPHAGTILAPQQRYSVGERIRRLLKLVATRTAEQMENRVEFLSDWC